MFGNEASAFAEAAIMLDGGLPFGIPNAIAEIHDSFKAAAASRGPAVEKAIDYARAAASIPNAFIAFRGIVPGLKAPTRIGSINPRLAQRLQAWKAYKAGGGGMDMRSWVSATQRQYGGVSSGYRSGYGAWEGRVHGNSRLSQNTAYLYRLEGTDGEHLKWGGSDNPSTRYPEGFMRGKQLVIQDEGQRSLILDIEREMIEIDPGPLNFEPWAGSRLK
jgi:hypothetical protein